MMTVDVTPVVEILDAYLRAYEPAIAPSDLPEVVTAILCLPSVGNRHHDNTHDTTGGGGIIPGDSLDPDMIDALVSQVLASYDPHGIHTRAATASATVMATAVDVAQRLTHSRSRQLVDQVGTALLARLGSAIAPTALPQLVQQIVPTLTQAPLTKQDVRYLAKQVIATFVPDMATHIATIDQAATFTTKLLTAALKDHQAERLVVDTLKSYASRWVTGTIAEADLPEVIKTIMAATQVDLNFQNGSLFIEKVSMTYRSGTTGTFVMPSAEHISQQVDQAIHTLLQHRNLPATDVTQPVSHEDATPPLETSTSGLHSIEIHSPLRTTDDSAV